MEEVGERGGELVASDEPAVVTETVFDAVMMENGESYGCLANPTSTNESERNEVFCQTDELPDELISSKEVPR